MLFTFLVLCRQGGAHKTHFKCVFVLLLSVLSVFVYIHHLQIARVLIIKSVKFVHCTDLIGYWKCQSTPNAWSMQKFSREDKDDDVDNTV